MQLDIVIFSIKQLQDIKAPDRDCQRETAAHQPAEHMQDPGLFPSQMSLMICRQSAAFKAKEQLPVERMGLRWSSCGWGISGLVMDVTRPFNLTSRTTVEVSARIHADDSEENAVCRPVLGAWGF